MKYLLYFNSTAYNKGYSFLWLDNRASLLYLDRELVNGTMKAAIQKDIKFNRNSTSRETGVHFDNGRGLLIA